ncbi:MAG TPA: hypothetical protein ENK48_06690 [Gammaproteobacteria bacterium]|nr:hypothetical protein [Gammaproteobacteria bacterium]
MRLLPALLIFLGCAAAQAEARQLVLVTSTPELQQAQLSRKEIRKLFLGRSVFKNGTQVVPVINESDPLAYQIFLQRVILMSAASYERHLLSRVFRRGGRRPVKLASIRRLGELLRGQPGTVSYMWLDEVRSDPRLLVLDQLWEGEP